MSAIQQKTFKIDFLESLQENSWKQRTVAALSHPWTKRAFAAAAALGTVALLYALFQPSQPNLVPQQPPVATKPSREDIVKVILPCLDAHLSMRPVDGHPPTKENLWECYGQATHSLGLRADDVISVIQDLETEEREFLTDVGKYLKLLNDAASSLRNPERYSAKEYDSIVTRLYEDYGPFIDDIAKKAIQKTSEQFNKHYAELFAVKLQHNYP